MRSSAGVVVGRALASGGVSPPAAPATLHTLASRSNAAKQAALATGLIFDFDAISIFGITGGSAVGTSWHSADPVGAVSSAGPATYSATGWTSDGGPAVVVGSSQYIAVDGTAASFAGDWSFACLLRPSANDNYFTVFSLADSAGSYFWQLYVSNTNFASAQAVGSGGSSGLLSTTLPIRTTEDSLVVYSYNATAKRWTVWVNGQKGTLDASAASGLPTPAKVTIAALFDGSDNFVGTVRRAAAWSRQLSDADYRAIAALWGVGHPGTGAPHRWQLFTVGNSIMAGFNGTTDTYPLSGLLAAPLNVTVVNQGHDGYTSELLLSSIAPSVISAAQAQPTMPAVAFLFEGRNSLFVLNDTPAQADAAIDALCDALRAAGIWVVVGTSPDCQGWATGGSNATRANLIAYNALVREGWQGHADAFVDVNAVLGDATNTTYFLVDEIHLTQQGEQILAQMAYGAIRGLAATALDALILMP